MPPTTHHSEPSADDGAEEVCGICFTAIDPALNPRGRLNSCNHIFCTFCISEWAKSTNVCPACKQRFTRIYTRDAALGEDKEIKVRKRNYAFTGYDSDEEELDETVTRSAMAAVACQVCGDHTNAVNMIFCDRRDCTFVAHMHCISLTDRPDTFLCPDHGGERLSVRTNEDESRRVEVTVGTEGVKPRPASSTSSSSSSSSDSGKEPKTHPPTRSHRPSAKAPVKVPVPRAQRPSSPGVPPPTPVQASGTSAQVPRRAVTNPNAVPLTQRRRPRQAEEVAGRDADSDELYFLRPNAHAEAARNSLMNLQAERQVVSQALQEKRDLRRRRLESYRLDQQRRHPHVVDTHSKTTGAGDAVLELVTAGEAELADPRSRAVCEARLTELYAKQMAPVIHRNRQLAQARLRLDSTGNPLVPAPPTPAEEQQENDSVWRAALEQARPQVQRAVEGRLVQLRRRKEEMLRVQQERETLALQKLVHLIARKQQLQRQQQSLS